MRGTFGKRPAGSGEAEAEDVRTGDGVRRRSVRSFVIRAGRMTAAQRRALDELGERYLIRFEGDYLDLDRLFGRPASRTVEVGFGDGDALVALAGGEPTRDFLGIEVYPPGVGRLLAPVPRGRAR